MTGTYVITTAPLMLPSKTSLVLYGTIKAAPGAPASSLVAITGESQVAVSGGLLDGEGADLFGIDAEGSTKVNIDSVTITDTGRDGIVLRGQGNAVWNSGSEITRCEATGAGGNGITIGSITQALVLDSLVRDSRGAGIQVGAAHSSIVNNVSRGNGLGIGVDASNDLVADNELRGNRSGGLRLESSSAGNAVLRNVIADNAGAGIDLDGSNDLLYANALSNAVDLIDRAAGNWVVARGTPLPAPVSRYFYPPTIDDRHAQPIMNGRGRTDLVLDYGPGRGSELARRQDPLRGGDGPFLRAASGEGIPSGPHRRLARSRAEGPFRGRSRPLGLDLQRGAPFNRPVRVVRR